MKLGWRMLLAIRRGKVAFSETMSIVIVIVQCNYKNGNSHEHDDKALFAF